MTQTALPPSPASTVPSAVSLLGEVVVRRMTLQSISWSFYARVQGREVNLEIDPPPDLAVEIDLSPPDVEKASIYARLGVAEIWRWRDGRLIVLALQAGGGYAEIKRSIALPDLPLDELAAALAGYPQANSVRAVEAFRRRLRERPPRG